MMQGKIDNDGFLYIDRGRYTKKQRCGYLDRSCGLFCPMFDEGSEIINKQIITLACCGVEIEIVEDMR